MKLNKSGFAIGMVLIIVFILMMAGGTFIFRMQGGVTSISVIERSTKATYLAEAGINLASAYLRSYGICFENGLTLPERSLDGGTFNTAMSRKTPNSTLVTILSVGSISGTSKAIMVQALCMPAPTTTPVVLTQNFNAPQLFADYSPEALFFPDAAHASTASVGVSSTAFDYPSQLVYFRTAEDNEIEKIIAAAGKKYTARDALKVMLPTIEGERHFFMENAKSPAADKKYSNIFGRKIKVPAEPGSVETVITAGSKTDKAQNMTAVMETIDEIVAASLYSQLWHDDSMNVELFRESFGDACDVYAACGTSLVKSGQPVSAVSNHIIFSGLPGISIASYNGAKNSIENLMPAVIVYNAVKPPDFTEQNQAAAAGSPAADNTPTRVTTARDSEQIIKADDATDMLEEKLAGKIAVAPAATDVVEKHMKEKKQTNRGEFRAARQRRNERNSKEKDCSGGTIQTGEGSDGGNRGKGPNSGNSPMLRGSERGGGSPTHGNDDGR
ncbi:MAG TPA: hypothetical protein PKK26_03175 [Candidatus Wallbacteria bacterium]|nr:hypothetical protein [Candidatus Wallbacteria bacterium]